VVRIIAAGNWAGRVWLFIALLQPLAVLLLLAVLSALPELLLLVWLQLLPLLLRV
jgi:hypothetical protein